MLEKIRDIMTRYVDLDPEEIREDSKLAEELGLTSFAVMSMMGDFEEEFGFFFNDTATTEIYTVKDIMNYIEKKQG